MMAEPTSCCAGPGGYCGRVDTLFNLPGLHVLDVAWQAPGSGRRRGCGWWWRRAGPGPAVRAVG